jgi:hypothetical protein
MNNHCCDYNENIHYLFLCVCLTQTPQLITERSHAAAASSFGFTWCYHALVVEKLGLHVSSIMILVVVEFFLKNSISVLLMIKNDDI